MIRITTFRHLIDGRIINVWLWWRGRVVLKWDRWRGFYA